MKHYLNNLKSVFDPEAELGDEGGFLDEIIFMAGIALVATILVNWLGTAATNKGADLAACIEGMNTYDNPNGGAPTRVSGSGSHETTIDLMWPGRACSRCCTDASADSSMRSPWPTGVYRPR